MTPGDVKCLQPGAASGVSAVIAHYGDPAVTKRVVDDLLSQSEVAVQVIVSDDCSPQPFPESAGVELVRSVRNEGFGSAINRGAKIATHEWLLILNSDIRLAHDFLKRAIEAGAPFQPAVCGFAQMGPDGQRPAAGPFPTLFRTLGQNFESLSSIARRTRMDRRWRLYEPGPSAPRRVDWLGGSALMLPRDLFDDIGGFDPRFFMYVEEIDLQRRLQARGVPSVLLAELEVCHGGGASTSGLDAPAEMLRSRLLFEEKVAGRSSRLLLESGLAAVIAADFLVQTLHGRRNDEDRPIDHARRRWATLHAAKSR